MAVRSGFKIGLRGLAVGLLLVAGLHGSLLAAPAHALTYDPIPVPCSQPGTLTLEGFGVNAYVHRYEFHLAAGQTVSATCTVATESVVPELIARAPNPFAFVFVPDGDSHFRMMAPEAGTYQLALSGSTPTTYTLQLETVAVAAYRISAVRVVAVPKQKRAYFLNSGLTPAYEGPYCPEWRPPAAYSPFRYVVERRRGSKWLGFSSAVAFAPSPGDSVYANLRLRKGTYRLRLRLRDASTRGRYGPYKTLKVR